MCVPWCQRSLEQRGENCEQEEERAAEAQGGQFGMKVRAD